MYTFMYRASPSGRQLQQFTLRSHYFQHIFFSSAGRASSFLQLVESLCMCVRMCACVHMCVHVCAYVCICVHVCAACIHLPWTSSS